MTAYSWTTGTSGDWSNAADWTGGGIPDGSTADVTIAATGTYTVTIATGESFTIGTLALDDAGATLLIAGTLDLAGTLTLTAGALEFGGTISGGTIVDPNDAFVASGGTLAGVTYQGTLDLSQNFDRLNIGGSLAVTGPGGTGNGTILDTGYQAALLATTSATLDDVTIDLGNGFAAATLGAADTTSAGVVLTLGSGATVDQTGAEAILASGFFPGDGIVNQGTIDAGLPGGTLDIEARNFTNQGSITVDDGGSLSLVATNFVNSGSIAVASGATLTFNASTFSSTGSFTLARGGMLDIDGDLTLAQLAEIGAAYGTVEIAGTLDDAGGTLDIGGGTALGTLKLTGTIEGGTLDNPGTDLDAVGGTLDGVTLDGTFAYAALGEQLNIAGGLTGGTNAVIEDPGYSTIAGGVNLGIEDSETIDDITFDADGTLFFNFDSPGGSTLTFGSGVDIVTPNKNFYCQIYIGNGTKGSGFINKGTITIGSDDNFFFDTEYFENLGAINIEKYGAISFEDDITTHDLLTLKGNAGTVFINSTLDNIARTLQIGGTDAAIGALGISDGGITGGTITGNSPGLAGNVKLAGVTFDTGSLTSTSQGTVVTVSGGLVVQGASGSAGTITMNGTTGGFAAASGIYVTDSETLNDMTIDLTSTLNDFLKIEDGRKTGLTLTLGPTFTFSLGSGPGSQITATLGSLYAVAGDAIVNDGDIVAAYGMGGTITIDPGSFTNNGELYVANYNKIALQPRSLTNLSDGVLTGGTYDILGTIVLSNNTYITDDDASITLDATGTVRSEDTKTKQQVTIGQTLTQIGTAGVLQVLYGDDLNGTADFKNAGSLVLAYGFVTETRLVDEAGATISGYGTIAAPIDNAGTITASVGTLVLQQAVSGTGALTIDSGSELLIDATAGAGQTVTFGTGTGTAILGVSDAAQFAATVSGFGASDIIDLTAFTYSSTGESLGYTANSGDTGGMLTVKDGSLIARITLFGQYVATGFADEQDGSGTDITYTPPATEHPKLAVRG